MSLSPGTKLGPYEILAALGAGGMGEVYKARDTRLDRTVAIKVLPSHLADNAQLRDRFECEARAVAKVEWHRGELFPRVGFIVTNLRRDAEGVVRFYNGRGVAEQWQRGCPDISAALPDRKAPSLTNLKLRCATNGATSRKENGADESGIRN